ncbi:MAG TPA: hypothetical protein DEF21_21680 [Thalassospira lucentensis]|uniref:DUF3784 domain-containing protein n=1 Tax=Thalassospira lucentensis TaxID=168935 RepID=A0A358HZA3_9PROT|nr:hypothetical protein [Thalassospira lucentensis]HCW66280.1 hypothetical protein [Thalassospira lucentensis]|tara:strand:+ start:2226 stop:2468 length:243 start_codon:yes stop_codon:yes gene_type:complete
MLSAIGLLLDIVGAALIFFYGVMPKVRSDGYDSIVIEQKNLIEQAKGERHERISRLGIILLAVGFVCQLAGNKYVQSLNW